MELWIFFFWIFLYFVKIVYVAYFICQKKFQRSNRSSVMFEVPTYLIIHWCYQGSRGPVCWLWHSVRPRHPVSSLPLSLCFLGAWDGSCYKQKQSRWFFAEQLPNDFQLQQHLSVFQTEVYINYFYIMGLVRGFWSFLLLLGLFVRLGLCIQVHDLWSLVSACLLTGCSLAVVIEQRKRHLLAFLVVLFHLWL